MKPEEKEIEELREEEVMGMEEALEKEAQVGLGIPLSYPSDKSFTPFSEGDIRDMLPMRTSKTMARLACKKLNSILSRDEEPAVLREHLLTFSNVLRNNTLSVETYVNAVRFASYKMVGMTNLEAYKKTFPEKVAKWMAEGRTNQDMSSNISMYARTKAVISIMEQAYIPNCLLYRDVEHEAIMSQVNLMRNAKSEKVRHDAANSLLVHLKKQDTAKYRLDIDIKPSSAINDLRAAIEELNQAQRQSLDSGMSSLKSIAEGVIINSSGLEDMGDGASPIALPSGLGGEDE